MICDACNRRPCWRRIDRGHGVYMWLCERCEAVWRSKFDQGELDAA
jgi:hypothetical protein